MRRRDEQAIVGLFALGLGAVLIAMAAVVYGALYVATRLTLGVSGSAAASTIVDKPGAVALAAVAGWAAIGALLLGLTTATPGGALLGAVVGALLGLVVGYQVHRTLNARGGAASAGALRLGSATTGWLRLPTPLVVPPGDRLKHIALWGPTGSGKSTLMTNMIMQDVVSGAGVIVIDPKDNLVDNVLRRLPAHRHEDLILFDATDTERPVGLNPFAGIAPRYRSLAASEFLAVFRRTFADSWGVRMEHVLRNVVVALLEVPGSTLLDIPRLLLDAAYREWVLERVTNPAVREFFTVEFEQVLRRRGDAIEPILNKVGPWITYPELRAIVAQQENSFDFRQVLDQSKILLVRIPEGAIGEDASALLGGLVVARVQLAAQSRVDISAGRRRPAYLYVDEFQRFVNSSFERILAEARGFGLGLVCTNQYPEQLSRNVQLAIEHNAGTFLRTSLQGSRYMLEFRRRADAADPNNEPLLLEQPRPLGPGNAALARQVRILSAQRYGRPPLALVRRLQDGGPPARRGRTLRVVRGRDVDEE